MLHVQNPDLVRARMQAADRHGHHRHEVAVALRAERRARRVRRWHWLAALGQSFWPKVGAVRSSASSAPENVMGERTPGTPSGAICRARATT